MRILIIVFIFVCNQLYAQRNNWPTLKSYDQDHIQRIAMPIGGKGDLRDWEIINRSILAICLPSIHLLTINMLAKS